MNSTKKIEMSEWQIKETSNNCSYLVKTQNFTFKKDQLHQCNHWGNQSACCHSNYCPIIIKKKKDTMMETIETCDKCYQGIIETTCIFCNGSGEGPNEHLKCRNCKGSGTQINFCDCKKGKELKENGNI